MKRANGTGSVEDLPDGRARIRVRLRSKRTQLGPIFETRDAAEGVLAAWNEGRGDGSIVDASELTLGEYGSTWLDRRELTGSRRRETVRSIDSERSVWTRQVLTSEIASLAITAVRPRDVDALSRELRARKAVHAITVGTGSEKRTELRPTTRPLSRAQQREAMRLVRSVLDEAVRAELLERNPADGACVAPGAALPRNLADDWLRWGEIETLLACDDISERDRRAYACAIGLALRVDDLRSVEVTRVRLDDTLGPSVTVFVSKSQRWHRVPVLPWLMPFVREQLASLPKGARWLFAREDGAQYRSGYDFGWSEHRERDGASVGLRRASALHRCGIARKIRFHDLRGTCATHLALGTWGRVWSLHEIQAMLAHSDQRVTERYVRRAVDALADAAKATPGGPALPMRAGAGITQSPCFQGTPRPGLEPGTNRLTALRSTEQTRTLAPASGQRVGNAVRLAREVLLLALEASPHTVSRAIELAGVVLEEARTFDASEGVG